MEDLGQCEATELLTPDSVERLRELSKQERVMIVGCDGYIRPLGFPPQQSDQPPFNIPLVSRSSVIKE